MAIIVEQSIETIEFVLGKIIFNFLFLYLIISIFFKFNNFSKNIF